MFKDFSKMTAAELQAEQQRKISRVDGYMTEQRDKFRTFVPEVVKSEEVVETALNQDLEEQASIE